MKKFLKILGYAIFIVIAWVLITIAGKAMIENALERVYERQNKESFYEGNTQEQPSDITEPEENTEDVDTSTIKEGAGVGAIMEPKDPVHPREINHMKTGDVLIEGLEPFLEDEQEPVSEQSVKTEESSEKMGEVDSSPVCYFVQYDEGVNSTFAAKVEREYLKVPENVRIHFQTGGWKLLVSYENLAKRIPGYGNSILAFTDSDVKTVFIDNRDAAAKAVVHEMGHYIDWANGLPSESEEFLSIYNAEVATFCSIHSTHSANTSTPMEYFAEFYEVMIRNPESVANACPRTYEFIQHYQNSL